MRQFFRCLSTTEEEKVLGQGKVVFRHMVSGCSFLSDT